LTNKSFIKKDEFKIKDSKSDRRQSILDVVKQKREVTIKDISSVVLDCSEKTIQRELNDLLLQGLIKKTGERRWSKYSVL
jgi:DeoR/GlpR family transcriptional regulator of sugar metabolism